MRLTDMSIKYRLLILCLIPTVVIIAISAKLVSNIQAQVERYQLIESKHNTLQMLNEFNQQTFIVLDKRLRRTNIKTSIALARQSLDLLKQTLVGHTEPVQSYTRSMSYIHELEELLMDIESVTREETVEIGRLINTILYDFYVDVHSIDTQGVNEDLGKLDRVIGDLSWLYYWMGQEAWLAHEIKQLNWQYRDYVVDYFRINERQQIYMDTFINSGANSQQVDILLTLFSRQEIRKGAYLKEQMLRQGNDTVDMSDFVATIKKRNHLVEHQLNLFKSDLQGQLNQNMLDRRTELWVIGGASLCLFVVMGGWGGSTLVRINTKLSKILTVMRRARSAGRSEQIPIDGQDEFAAFALELNHVIEQQAEYEQKLLKAKESAEGANQAKSLFLANMSHEIRTPLNAIIGMAEILSESHLNEGQKELLADIDTSSHALLILINDILDLSKIESGKLLISVSKTNIREVVFETVNMVSAKAFKQEVELRIEFSESLPTYIETDDFRFKQILMNLLSNAVKFTKNGKVTVEMTTDVKQGLVCHVTDTGVGIAQEKLDEIFRPFTQEDGSITRRFGGTGLGLAICQQLVEIMQGGLSVSSTVGVGSRFSFNLPLLVSEIQPEPSQALLPALFIGNGTCYRSLIEGEAKLCGLTLTYCNRVEQSCELNGEFSVILYCPSPSASSMKDIAQLRARFIHAEIIGLYHHLTPYSEMDRMISAHLTLPILGHRFDSALQNAIAERQPDNNYALSSGTNLRNRGIKRVLIVEDNLMNQKIASFFLSKAGVQYEIASNGLDAVNMIRNGEEFNAILMDCMMPVMDGLTATKEIREWEKSQRTEPIPIIALTASVLPEEIQSCFDAGMDAYLPKPYKSQQLFDTFERLSVVL